MPNSVSPSAPSVKESFYTSTVQEQNYSIEKSALKEQLLLVSNAKEYKLNRVFDLIIGLVGLLLFVVLFPFFALGIKLSSRGSVLFKQRRTGKMGYEFLCYKFRTMHQVNLKTVEGKPVVTQKKDKRVFWFGSILRKTNLDELPQILNVIKGEMSLVGPRPYPVDECRHWNNTFDDFYYRYLVRPGVSGFAQVNGFRGGTLDVEHMRQRLDKDLIYVQKKSLWFDIKILFLTVKQMVTFRTNAH